MAGDGGVGCGTSRSFIPPNAQPEPSAPPSVSAVLRIVLLERVIPTRGGYAVANTLTRAKIVCAVLLIFQLGTGVVRWSIRAIVVKDVSSNIMHTADLLVAVSVTTQCICAVAATALEPRAVVVAYRTTVHRLDKLLEPEQPHAVDVARIRRRVLCIYFPRILYLMMELCTWTIIYGIRMTWSHYGDSLCKIMSDLAMLCYTVRLIEVENRVAALERRMRRAAAALRQWSSEQTISIDVKEIRLLQPSAARECYLLLCEMCAIINYTFAFQVVVGFVRNFILITTVIHQFDSVYKNPEASPTEGSLESMAILPVVIYLFGAIQVVFITALQVEHVANVQRLHRNIVHLAETLAIQPAQGGSGKETQMFWCALATLCHRQPLQFTACGFFNVDYSLLVTMFGTAVTYTVLLIQMNDSSHQE